ncbi:MAG: polysaccharide biosynthesis tyrosine autokinase [Cytophagales bacterium]|nr:polysaccharide biosynthesis tyrosine autokinase [Cytophagales bacterium]
MEESYKYNAPSGGNNLPQTGFVQQADGSDRLGDLDIDKLLLILRKNIVWIAIILILPLTIAFLYIRYTKPLYESSSILKLNIKNDAGVLGLQGVEGSTWGNLILNNLSGEIELIKSKLIYDQVIDNINYDVSYYAYGRFLYDERYKNAPFKVEHEIKNQAFYSTKFDVDILDNDEFRLTYYIGEKPVSNTYKFAQKIENKDFVLTLYKTDFLSEGDAEKGKSLVSSFIKNILTWIGIGTNGNNSGYFFRVNSKAALTNYMANNLSVQILNVNANTIKISLKDYNRVKAQDFVNAIDSVYLKQTIENKNKASEQTIAFVDDQLVLTEVKLQKYELELERFLRENKTANVQTVFSKFVEKIEELEKQRLALKIRALLLHDLINIIKSNQDLSQFIPSLSLPSGSKLIQLTEELNKLQEERNLLLSSNKENTFVVKKKDIRIENLKKNLIRQIGLNKEMLEEQIEEYNNKISSTEKVILSLPSKETAYTRIKRFYDLYEKFYLLLMEKRAEFGIAKAGTIPEFVILSPANISDTPISPNVMMAYMIGISIGMFLCIALIAGKYMLHNTITGVEELEKITPTPILGIVPVFDKKKISVSPLLVSDHPKSAISEALRSIRTNLEFICPNKKKKLITITSSISGEGKTFIAINLGGIISLSNTKVLILDLDLRKPRIHQTFGGENKIGISTFLIGKNSIEDCIQRTPVKSLDYISAGPIPPNPSELILMPQFDKMINSLFKQYDVIIIDTPPVGLVTDAVLVMKNADIPIYIVRAGYSKKGFEKIISKLVTRNEFVKLSIILNAFEHHDGAGYGYGYGYGYYEDENDVQLPWIKRVFAKTNQ